MKNRTIFSSVLLVVLVSALFFSVSTVFGAQLPSQNPPAGLAAPTFSSLILTGPGNIDLTGSITNSSGSFGGSVNIADPLIVGGSIDVTFIKNSSGNLTFQDTSNGAKTLTQLLDKGPAEAWQEAASGIYTPVGEKVGIGTSDLSYPATLSVSGGVLIKNGEIDIQSALKNGTSIDANFVTINDSLNVKKAIDVNDSIFNGSSGAVNITDTDGLIVAGPINVPTIKNSVGAVPVPVTIDDALDVSGHLSAASIGSYVNTPSSFIVVNANGGTGTVTSACAAGYVITGCGFYGWSGITVYAAETSTTANTCTVRAYNSTTANKNIQAVARCFNPGG
jgi:hypothetical protein